MCNLDDLKTIFPRCDSEVNCASDDVVETTKTSLPYSPGPGCSKAD